jgi:hypothetical protein
MKVLGTSQGIFLIFPSRGDLAKTIRNLGEHLNRVTKEGKEAPYVYVLTDEPDPEKIRPTIDEIKGKHVFFGIDPGASDFIKAIIREINKNEAEWFDAFCLTELGMTPEEASQMILKEYGIYLLEHMKREAARNSLLASTFRR